MKNTIYREKIIKHKDLLNIFLNPIKLGRLKYIITSCFASSLYASKNKFDYISFVVLSEKERISQVIELFSPEEFEFGDNYFQVIHIDTRFMASIFIPGDSSSFNWELKNARQIQTDDSVITIAPPEYIILQKLNIYRNKVDSNYKRHLRDAAEIINEQDLDKETIESRARVLMLQSQWIEALNLAELLKL